MLIEDLLKFGMIKAKKGEIVRDRGSIRINGDEDTKLEDVVLAFYMPNSIEWHCIVCLCSYSHRCNLDDPLGTNTFILA